LKRNILEEINYYNGNWLNLSWSKWISLNPQNGKLSSIKAKEGLYRIRHTKLPGLIYIGETGKLRGRIRSLARGAHAKIMPFRDTHTAAPTLWAIRDSYGEEFVFSYTTPEICQIKRHRKGLEDALIAVYRYQEGKSPAANFGRIIKGYKQSSYRSGGIIGGKLAGREKERNTKAERGPLKWINYENVLAPNWMGLNWSDNFYLHSQAQITTPEVGVYRIWIENEAPPLSYIGESKNISRRLYSHEKNFNETAIASYATPPDINEKHKRTEIESDLLGAHYLVTGRPPYSQY